MPSTTTEITLEELAKHNTEADAWMAIMGKVYDVTSYISKHPGGKSTILQGIGKDATKMFKQAHSYINPDAVLKGKQVGILSSQPRGATSPPSPSLEV